MQIQARLMERLQEENHDINSLPSGQKYGEYATLSKINIEKPPERFTFGQKFYINEVKKLLKPSDALLSKINDESFLLTKEDWN